MDTTEYHRDDLFLDCGSDSLSVGYLYQAMCGNHLVCIQVGGTHSKCFHDQHLNAFTGTIPFCFCTWTHKESVPVRMDSQHFENTLLHFEGLFRKMAKAARWDFSNLVLRRFRKNNIALLHFYVKIRHRYVKVFCMYKELQVKLLNSIIHCCLLKIAYYQNNHILSQYV